MLSNNKRVFHGPHPLNNASDLGALALLRIKCGKEQSKRKKEENGE